ncbi:MAG: methyltransferase domain-containing protein [Geobacter sp.]|nr:methyltransferase domain-containing protein [Geobacter sp.]
MGKKFKNLKAAIIWRIKESGLLPSYKVRENLAKAYLRGEGVEIGALHLPLKVPGEARVRYVDLASRADNISRHPELPADKIVETDFVDDGFELAAMEQASHDFLIANHVLEHTPNPLQVLINWGRVLKPGGILFVSIPLAEKCFDKGRPITTLEHLIVDYEQCRSENRAAMELSNKEHYREWLSISTPAFLRERGQRAEYLDQAQLNAEVETFSSKSTEIHFHTFSKESFQKLLEYFVLHVDRSFVLKELRSSRGNRESVAVLQKISA